MTSRSIIKPEHHYQRIPTLFLVTLHFFESHVYGRSASGPVHHYRQVNLEIQITSPASQPHVLCTTFYLET